jgi:hypothetical protein
MMRALVPAGAQGGNRRSLPRNPAPEFVMAGLDPAIHVFVTKGQDMDARHEAGHAEEPITPPS